MIQASGVMKLTKPFDFSIPFHKSSLRKQSEIPKKKKFKDAPYRVLPREQTGHSKHSSNNTRKDSAHGHNQMVSIKIRLIIFFAAKDGEALYSQQKQDWELTVVQIMNSLLPNSELN